jgi:hypothetical protein
MRAFGAAQDVVERALRVAASWTTGFFEPTTFQEGHEIMAKRQTRRSISVKGITYQRLKNFCEGQGLSVSGYLEDIIANNLDAENVPIPEKVDPRPTPKAETQSDEIISQHFTF